MSDVVPRSRIARAFALGGALEAALGGAAAVAAVLGMLGMHEGGMAAVATIAIGAALLAHAGAFFARAAVVNQTRPITDDDPASGLPTEVLAGGLGVLAGACALYAPSMLAIAILVYGGALLLGAGAPPLYRRFRRKDPPPGQTAAGIVAGAGVAVLLLGLWAAVSHGPNFNVVLLAELIAGAALVLGGTTLATRLAKALGISASTSRRHRRAAARRDVVARPLTRGTRPANPVSR